MAATPVDSSAVVQAFGARQRQTAQHRELLRDAAGEGRPLTTTRPCFTEASYMLAVPRRHTMPSSVGKGAVAVFPVDAQALDELASRMARWTSRPKAEMDLADASLVWLAGQTGVTRIMTTDHRDFSRDRLPDGRAFEIL